MTTFEGILESVGINHSELVQAVNERRQGDALPTAPLSLEHLALAVEQLADRLAEVADQVGDENSLDDYYVGGISSAVLSCVEGRKNYDELLVVRAHLGLGETDSNGHPPILASVPLFGHRHLRCVKHTILNLDDETFERHVYLVDGRTGEVTAVPAGKTAEQAADDLAQAKAATNA